MFQDGLYSPKIVTVVSIVLGVICIGGACVAFLFDSENGLVFEVLLLAIGVLSLALGAMIVRRSR